MATFYLQNFGCRANQADGAALAAALERRGWAPAGSAAAAAWVVLNTCTVTAEADAEAQRAIRRLRREHPEAKIAVTGCYAERAPGEVAALAGVTLVAGNAAKSELAERLVAITGAGLEAEAAAQAPKLATLAALGRVRPVVKVQEGCDRHCSYCIIPTVRGASRSLPLGGVLEQIQELATAGAQEVVVSGINLGQWGRDLGAGLGLPELVRAILEQTTLPRLRLSSVEPLDWCDALTGLLAAAPRLARHVHLPLQSGSDGVLRRMGRRYTAARYAELVTGLRARVPLAAIGADVMVGFPGESDVEFEETRALVAALPLTYLHVFSFSSRTGTAAARGLESGRWAAVPAAVAAERGRLLRRLSAEKRAAFLETLVGERLRVVTLAEPRAAGCWGLSDNYVKVAVSEAAPANQMFEVMATAACGDYLEARDAIWV